MAISLDIKYMEFFIRILEGKEMDKDQKEAVIKQAKRLVEIEKQKMKRRAARIKIDI